MLYVLRHGRTESNASGLLLGRSDPPLDDLGVRQAAAAAGALPVPDRVVTSPLRRARQTAGAFGVDVEVDERWIELDYGAFDGTPVAEVPRETWAAWQADLDWAPPGGESHRQLGARVRAACEELLDEATIRDVVVVTHVSPVKAAMAWALGVGDEVAWRCFVGTAAIMSIGAGRFGPSLRGFNDTSHLARLG
ncbi:MAG: histidine phosphatase family protein [Acidimicrobiales bacterium]|jgi:broad specificity phosphatase PhoE|nr:histidine phosphatase family protein [Acidimicrobiales bacterium]